MTAEPTALQTTRLELHRVATHILARRRHAVTGRFGLRATPGGIGTPAFGPPDAIEVLRTSGADLVHEVGGRVQVVSMDGATLAELAAAVDVDLATAFTVGKDTPAVGDVDAAIRIDQDAALELAGWFALGWRALDVVGLDATAPAPIQLWPEHFDASCLLAVGPGPEDRCDVGVSPGDDHHDEPYLYVGPWEDRRPGDEAYWNAPFGALRPRSAVTSV
ncbi:MAG TPA: hypothetical protein VFG94_10505, partial [Acidimicrobiales bacterium]|nr:hypothetical protein [Acidimicrobiales bacterium]